MNPLSTHCGSPYRGRLAPSPTGFLHLGHARTFWVAQQRATGQGGALVLRNEDLDPQRSKPEFVAAMLEDLRWFGFRWSEGPDCGGPFGSYNQSERTQLYRAALDKLRASRRVFGEVPVGLRDSGKRDRDGRRILISDPAGQATIRRARALDALRAIRRASRARGLDRLKERDVEAIIAKSRRARRRRARG